jgi:hypothetical protein
MVDASANNNMSAGKQRLEIWPSLQWPSDTTTLIKWDNLLTWGTRHKYETKVVFGILNNINYVGLD